MHSVIGSQPLLASFSSRTAPTRMGKLRHAAAKCVLQENTAKPGLAEPGAQPSILSPDCCPLPCRLVSVTLVGRCHRLPRVPNAHLGEPAGRESRRKSPELRGGSRALSRKSWVATAEAISSQARARDSPARNNCFAQAEPSKGGDLIPHVPSTGLPLSLPLLPHGAPGLRATMGPSHLMALLTPPAAAPD